MTQAPEPFGWTEVAEQAAQLLAQGNLATTEIAPRLDVSRSTLFRWRQHPEFQARVDELLAEYRAEALRVGLAVRERRVKALNDRWNRLRLVIEQRADDPAMKTVPGGTTGLLNHDVKAVGKGDDFALVDLYRVDVGLLKELRELEKQAAIEVGQWAEKREHTGALTIRVEYADADTDPDAPPPPPGAAVDPE